MMDHLVKSYFTQRDYSCGGRRSVMRPGLADNVLHIFTTLPCKANKLFRKVTRALSLTVEG